jgi:acetyl-CoA synthetase
MIVGSALVSHTTVAETAVTGIPDGVKGNIISVFVIRRAGYSANDELKIEHFHDVKITPGLITIPSEIKFVLSPPRPAAAGSCDGYSR